jgi:uncharacterized protein YndB with AHSA1/START domain
MIPKDKAHVQTNENSVTIERFYATTPERLYQAWTDPKLVCQWLAPGPMRCDVTAYDVRSGGKWRLQMRGRGPDGQPMSMDYEGTFAEVAPGKRIVMLWPPAMPGVEPGAKDPPSRVVVTFTPVPGGTRLMLTQDGMPDRDGAQNAAYGWEMAFENLARLA